MVWWLVLEVFQEASAASRSKSCGWQQNQKYVHRQHWCEELGRVVPIGEGMTGEFSNGAKEEVMAEVADATKMFNCKGKKLDVLGVEGEDDVKAGEVSSIDTNFHFCFLIVPVMSRIHIGRQGHMMKQKEAE